MCYKIMAKDAMFNPQVLTLKNCPCIWLSERQACWRLNFKRFSKWRIIQRGASLETKDLGHLELDTPRNSPIFWRPRWWWSRCNGQTPLAGHPRHPGWPVSRNSPLSHLVALARKVGRVRCPSMTLLPLAYPASPLLPSSAWIVL